jgi:hypothetical protein
LFWDFIFVLAAAHWLQDRRSHVLALCLSV